MGREEQAVSLSCRRYKKYFYKLLDCKLLYYTRRVVRVAMTRTTRFFIDRKASAVDIRWGLHLLGRCLCKRKPRRGDRIQAGVEAPDKHAQKEKAPKGRWNGSMSVIVPSLLRSFDGGCFHTGVTLPLTPACSPSLLRSLQSQ